MVPDRMDLRAPLVLVVLTWLVPDRMDLLALLVPMVWLVPD